MGFCEGMEVGIGMGCPREGWSALAYLRSVMGIVRYLLLMAGLVLVFG